MRVIRSFSSSTVFRAGLAFPAAKQNSSTNTSGVWTVVRSWFRKSAPAASGSNVSGKIDQIAEGLNTVDRWKEAETGDAETRNLASFEIVNPGPSALLLVKIQGKASVFAQTGALVAKSPLIASKIVSNGGPVHGLVRAVGGGQFFLDHYSAQKSQDGDFILAPAHQSDIALLKLDGSAEYAVRSDSALAFSEHLTVGVQWRGASRRFLDYIFAGTGKLAVTGCGGVYRFCLKPKETYLVASNRLLAYETSIRVSKPFIDSLASETLGAPLWKQRDAKAIWQSIRNSTLYYARRLAGKRPLHLLEGPGDFYLSARSVPSLDFLKLASQSRASFSPTPATPASKPPAHVPTRTESTVEASRTSIQTDLLQSVNKPDNLVTATKSISKKQP